MRTLILVTLIYSVYMHFSCSSGSSFMQTSWDVSLLDQNDSRGLTADSIRASPAPQQSTKSGTACLQNRHTRKCTRTRWSIEGAEPGCSIHLPSAVRGLEAYLPLALTPVIAKSMEKLFVQRLNVQIPPDQISYWHHFSYRSTDPSISIPPHLCSQPAGKSNRTLLHQLHLTDKHCSSETLSICGLKAWWSQLIRTGTYTSSTVTLSTYDPQGCILSIPNNIFLVNLRQKSLLNHDLILKSENLKKI